MMLLFCYMGIERVSILLNKEYGQIANENKKIFEKEGLPQFLERYIKEREDMRMKYSRDNSCLELLQRKHVEIEKTMNKRSNLPGVIPKYVINGHYVDENQYKKAQGKRYLPVLTAVLSTENEIFIVDNDLDKKTMFGKKLPDLERATFVKKIIRGEQTNEPIRSFYMKDIKVEIVKMAEIKTRREIDEPGRPPEILTGFSKIERKIIKFGDLLFPDLVDKVFERRFDENEKKAQAQIKPFQYVVYPFPEDVIKEVARINDAERQSINNK